MAAEPFYGTTGRRKQRVAAAELLVPQDLSKYYGQTRSSGRRQPLRRGSSTRPPRDYGSDGSVGWLRNSVPLQAGRHDHATFQERADESVRCLGFWAKLLHADRPTGLGPGSQVTSSGNSFYVTLAYLTFGHWRFELRSGHFFLERHLFEPVDVDARSCYTKRLNLLLHR